MRKIILATGNPDKAREIRQILPEDEILTMKDVGLSLEIVEDGTSFLENARIKASAVREALLSCGTAFDYVFADDSGLEIDYFDKAPGIYSSRWLGEDTPYTEKNRIVLEKMDGIPEEKRTARYVCAMVALNPRGEELSAVETVEGIIADHPQGNGGFGYDPIFIVPDLGSFGDMSAEEKHAVSHRGKASRRLKALIEQKEG